MIQYMRKKILTAALAGLMLVPVFGVGAEDTGRTSAVSDGKT